MPLQGFQPIPRPWPSQLAETILRRLYNWLPAPDQPISGNHEIKVDRNEEIRRRYAAGEDARKLAEEYRISVSRLHQIIKFQRKWQLDFSVGQASHPLYFLFRSDNF